MQHISGKNATATTSVVLIIISHLNRNRNDLSETFIHCLHYLRGDGAGGVLALLPSFAHDSKHHENSHFFQIGLIKLSFYYHIKRYNYICQK